MYKKINIKDLLELRLEGLNMVGFQENRDIGSEITNSISYKDVTLYAPGGDQRIGFNTNDVQRIQQLIDFAYNGSLGTVESLFLQNGAPIAEQISGLKAGRTDGFLKNIWTQVEQRRFKR